MSITTCRNRLPECTDPAWQDISTAEKIDPVIESAHSLHNRLAFGRDGSVSSPEGWTLVGQIAIQSAINDDWLRVYHNESQLQTRIINSNTRGPWQSCADLVLRWMEEILHPANADS